MAVYRFANQSDIDEISVITAPNGAKRAYLHASKSAKLGRLSQIKQFCEEQDWQAMPASLNEKNVLEIRSFGSDKNLISELKKRGFTEGNPIITKQNENTTSWKDWFSNRTLQASGALYLTGDYNFIRYGMKEGHWEDTLAGVMYALGTQSTFWFGNNNQSDLQIADLAKKIEKYLDENNHKIPENCSLHAITHDHEKGLIKTGYDLARRYPSEIFNFFTGLAGLMVAAAAVRHKLIAAPTPGQDATSINKMRFEGALDTMLGLTTVAATTIGGLVEEKKRDPDSPPPKTIFERVWNFVQERPLAITGMGLMVSTLCHAGSTYVAYKEASRTSDSQRLNSVFNRAMFVGTNLIAELLTSISSKGHGHGVVSDDSVKDSIFSASAELIAKRPKNERAVLIDIVTNFLEKPTVFAEDRDKITRELTMRVEKMDKNPWACCNAANHELIASQKKWQDKISAPLILQTPQHFNTI